MVFDMSKKAYIFFKDGCEEIEGLTVVDILRRAGVEIVMVSATGKKEITGSHSMVFATDALFNENDYSDADAVIIPGGMQGTKYLQEDDVLKKVLRECYDAGKVVAAICAAPTVLAATGILDGKHATCYPGFEEFCSSKGAKMKNKPVVQDENVITGQALGAAVDFSLAIVAALIDEKIAEQTGRSICRR